MFHLLMLLYNHFSRKDVIEIPACVLQYRALTKEGHTVLAKVHT